MVAALSVVVAAGIVTGLAGFGFGVVSVPPLLLIYDPPTVVALGMILGWSGGWVPLLGVWREVRVRKLAMLLPWAMVGLLVGTAALRTVPSAYLKLAASAVVLAFAVVLLRRSAVHTSGPGWRWARPVAGLTSGALLTSTGLGGPPVVLLFTLRNLPVHAFRASILAYLLTLDLIGLPTLVAQGAVSREHLLTGAMLAPVAIVGRLVGMRLAGQVTTVAFRRITLALLVVTGAVGVVNASVGLLG